MDKIMKERLERFGLLPGEMGGKNSIEYKDKAPLAERIKKYALRVHAMDQKGDSGSKDYKGFERQINADLYELVGEPIPDPDVVIDGIRYVYI